MTQIENRNKEWLEIWNRKYQAFSTTIDTHVLDGFDGLSKKDWQNLVHFFLAQLSITQEDAVLEVGCGAGAFLKELKAYRKIGGVDYSESAIKAIKQILDGEFHVAEAIDLPFSDNSFDKVLSYGVFFYFDSYDYAKLAFSEMMRVMKPSGTLFIGDINDLDKKETALRLREESSQERKTNHLSEKKVDHLYFSKTFFEKLATEHDMEITFINHENIDFYYNAAYRYSIILQKNKNS